MEEISRSWRALQLAAHPDQGGTTEAAAYLNTTKDYAIHCIKNPGKGREVTNSCKRHGCEYNEVTSPYPIYQPGGASAASSRTSPATPSHSTTGQRSSPPPEQPYEADPWAPADSPQDRTTGRPMASPKPAPATPPPHGGNQSQQNAYQTQGADSNSRQACPPPSYLTEKQKKKCWQQTFRCKAEYGGCGAEATYSGLGHDPFELAQRAGWHKPNCGSWERKAYCRSCAAKHFGLPANHTTPQEPHLPPTPTLAPQQSTYVPLTRPYPWESTTRP